MNQLYVHIKYGYIWYIVLNEKKQEWEDEIKKEYIFIKLKIWKLNIYLEAQTYTR